MIEYALIFSVVMLGGFVQGLTGFGSIMISLPLLSLMLDIKTVIPVISLLALCLNSTVCYSVRRSISPGRLTVLLIATLPGLPLGAWALKYVSPESLTLLLGLLIVAFMGHQLLFRPARRELGKPWAAVTGLTAGFLGGSIGANGPPIIVYVTSQPWPKDEIKATLAGYFLMAGIGISGSHYFFGMITPDVIDLFLRLVPALALGMLLGIKCYGKLSEDIFRRAAMILAFGLGLMITFKAI